jgi:hypothetical protein
MTDRDQATSLVYRTITDFDAVHGFGDHQLLAIQIIDKLFDAGYLWKGVKAGTDDDKRERWEAFYASEGVTDPKAAAEAAPTWLDKAADHIEERDRRYGIGPDLTGATVQAKLTDDGWSVTLQRPSETPHIIVTGNPVDGFRYIGPFGNAEEAVEWAEHVDLEPDWWVAEVRVPNDDEPDLTGAGENGLGLPS